MKPVTLSTARLVLDQPMLGDVELITQYCQDPQLLENVPLPRPYGSRTAARDLGYWLGAPHRGNGYMSEAVGGVLEWLFGLGWSLVSWECVVGNSASVSVARKAGFRYTQTAPSRGAFRDGSKPMAWHGVLGSTDDRGEKPGWP